MRFPFLFTSVLVWMVSLTAIAAENDPGQSFEEFVEQLLEENKVPGLAVGIVRDGELVYARGFGQRNIETGEPVTPETLFAIGSTTKAFTATAAGLALEENGLSLDQPVHEYTPGFRLKSDTATLQASMIDLLAHRTGVPRHDVVWYGYDQFPREYFFERLQYLEPSAGLREKWQYNNLMYLAAGYITGQLTGKTWEEYVQERLLAPLGMQDTGFSVDTSKTSSNFAQPYGRRKGVAPVAIPFRSLVAIGPAGSINSNVRDLAKWLRLNMNRGEWNGQQLVPGSIMEAVHTPQAVVSELSLPFPEFSQALYTLGWVRQQYRGHDWVWHDGGIDGFRAHVGFFPRQNIGLIVLQNADYADVKTLVTLRAADEALGLEPIDWLNRFKELNAEKNAGAGEEEQATAVAERPPRPLEDYVGTYSHPAYGDVVLTASDGQLQMSFHNMQFTLTPLVNGTFRLSSEDIPDELEPAYFQINSRGEIHELLLKLEAAVDPISFRR